MTYQRLSENQTKFFYNLLDILGIFEVLNILLFG